MPQAIPAILAAVGASAVVVAVAQLIITIGVIAYGAGKEKKAARRRRDEYNAGLEDRTVTRIATEAPHMYVYGIARVGSAIVAMFSSGAKDEFKHLVCVHAAHECDGFEEIYVYGKALGQLDANGNVMLGHEYFQQTTEYMRQNIPGGQTTITLAHTPMSGSLSVVRTGVMYADDGTPIDGMPAYTLDGLVLTLAQVDPQNLDTAVSYTYILDHPRVRVQKHLGTATDPADAYLMSVVPDKWTSSAVLRGFCYTVITLDLHQPEFQGGIPPIEVLLRGKKLYDPRTGVTQWSQNPALVLYDYLTGPVCNVAPDDIPVSQYITAANACDEIIGSFTFRGVTYNRRRYMFNGTITSDQGQGPVLEKIAQSMAGTLVSTTWDVSAGKYVAPVMALTQDDIVGATAITPGISDSDLYNGVRGQYISFENDYVPTDFKQFQNAAYLAADGRDLWTNIDFPFTDSVQQVHNLCRIYVEDQRNSYTVVGEFSLKAWKLKVGERITLTSATFGWSAKVFRVMNKKFAPSGMVELTLKEDAESIWDLADAVEVDSTPNSNLPNPFAIAPLASLACESGTDALLLQSDGSIVSRILATWPQATTQAVLRQGLIEIEWQDIVSGVWQKTQAGGSDTQAYLSPVNDGAVYAVRARTVNPSLNVKSDWVYATPHQVIGKTEKPPQVDRFKLIEQPGGIRQFFWDVLTPPSDLFAFEVRYSLGTTIRAWDQMIPLFAKDRNARLHETTEPAGDGVYTFAIVAIDTTGNESPLRYITEVMDGDAFGAVHLIELPHQEYFPGIKTNCFVSGSVLANAGLLTWADLDVEWGVTETLWGNSPSSPIVYEHTVIDVGAVLTLTVRASSLSSGAAFIEISTSDDGSTYAEWSPVPSSQVTARYYKFRWTVSGANPILYRAQIIFYT